MRIVLDTSCFITAIRSPGGAAAEVVRMIATHKLIHLMDYKLACEYRDVALRPLNIEVAQSSARKITETIQNLERLAESVSVTVKHRPLSLDPNDDMILDLAINGKAAAIVTQNRKHFIHPAERFRILVLSPAELLYRYRSQE